MIRSYRVKSDAAVEAGLGRGGLFGGGGQRECPPTNFVETHKYQVFEENATGNIPLNFIINAAEEHVLFEDFTENHNKTYIQLSNLPLTPGMIVGFDMILRITTDASEDPVSIVVPFSQTRTVQYENVRRVTVQLIDLPLLFQQRVSFYLEKTFCISCSEGVNSNGM